MGKATYSLTLYVCNGCSMYGVTGSGTGELASDRDVGGMALCRERCGLKRPGEDAGVLLLVLMGNDVAGGSCV